MRSLFASAVVLAAFLFGCAESVEQEGRGPAPAAAPVPTTTSESRQAGPENGETDASSDPESGREASPSPIRSDETKAPVESTRPTSTFGGIAGASGIAWEGCQPPEHSTDWVGNSFRWTLCWSDVHGVASFYEYDASEYDGMRAEYVVNAHITPTWGVAAESSSVVRAIVRNLEATGY